MDSERDGCHGMKAAILVNVYKVRLNVYKIKQQAHPYYEQSENRDNYQAIAVHTAGMGLNQP